MKHLKKLRAEHQLTQKQLGEILHVSRGAIGTYERGERVPEPATMKLMCEYFDVSLEYLLDFTEQRSEKAADQELLHAFYSIPEEQRKVVSDMITAYNEWLKKK